MKLVGVEKIAEILDINENTIYDWTATRKIPHYKVGRLVKFDIDAVMDWLATCEVKPYNKGTGGRSHKGGGK
ncbi:MAG: helix-turn-helix domain-containing protein [Deltaproteobacteria bacterium]|jgi:excisionase family DNA binding protein|nr:helix-turn-helix domain-containing protein [Deltaproteobacteria bacterium]